MSIEKFGEIIHHCIATHTVISSGGRELRLKCDKKDRTEIETLFKSVNIDFNFITDTEFEFNQSIIHNNTTAVFLDDKAFVNNAEIVSQNFDTLDIVILQNGSGFLFKAANETFSEKKALFWNALYYPQLIEVFITNKEFTMVHDTVVKKIIIYSDESKGPFPIGYQKAEIRCGELENVSELLLILQKEFTRIEFVKYFKNIVALVTKTVEEKDRMFHLAKSLRTIITLASRDHDIYLSGFAFSKIQTEFKEARIKYFETIEKNIDLVGKQIASFPLTFAASAFAGFQVKDKPLIIVAIFLAYALYTILAFRIISVATYNTKNLEEDVNAETENMEANYPEIYSSFSKDYNKVKTKIGKLKSLTGWLKVTLVGLLVVFLAFGIYINTLKPTNPTPTKVQILKSGSSDTINVRFSDSLFLKSKSLTLSSHHSQ